jgi:hypothetical protein
MDGISGAKAPGTANKIVLGLLLSQYRSLPEGRRIELYTARGTLDKWLLQAIRAMPHPGS